MYQFLYNIFSVTIMAGVLGLIFVSPVLMNLGLIRVSDVDYKYNNKDLLICCIPIVNHFYGWRKYSGEVISMSGVASILAASIIAIRVTLMYTLPPTDDIQTFSVIAALAVLLISWIMTGVQIYGIMSESGCYKPMYMVLCSLSIIIGQVVIGLYMPRVVEYYQAKEKNKNLYE